jgi:aryl-alcohol dehydrogenase-like predicted oxidoreductase
MKYVRLGPSGLKVSQFCLGTWHMPRSSQMDEYGARKVDTDELTKVIKAAFDEGLNFIDTANRYHGAMAPVDVVHRGNSEKVLGEVLRGYERESFVIATKVGSEMTSWENGKGLSRKHVMWQIGESLRRLHMDHVDVYLMHVPDPDTPHLETLRALDDLVRSGRVHYLGSSNHSEEEVVDFMQLASQHHLHGLVTLQEEYSLLHREPEKTLFPMARHYGLSVMAYSPLAEGMLSEKYLSGIPKDSRAAYAEHLKKSISEDRLKVVKELSSFAKDKGISLPQLALAWILNKQSSLDVTIIPIIGISNAAQLAENLRAFEISLSEEDIKSIEEIASKMPEQRQAQ